MIVETKRSVWHIDTETLEVVHETKDGCVSAAPEGSLGKLTFISPYNHPGGSTQLWMTVGGEQLRTGSVINDPWDDVVKLKEALCA